jgi:hypothetical protein
MFTLSNHILWLCRGSTVVEHSTRNPKIEGSNLATGKGKREKICQKVLRFKNHFGNNCNCR